MSNAMRSGKRMLAGVAAVALGAGVMTFVAAPSASAAEFSATGVATTPIRVSYPPGGVAGATVPIQVPKAFLSFTTPITLPQSAVATTSAVLSLVDAPSGTAVLNVDNGVYDGVNPPATSSATMDDSLGGPSSATVDLEIDDTIFAGGTVTVPIYLNQNDPTTVPGFYGFRIVLDNGVHTANVDGGFSTRGAPTTMTVSPGYATTPLTTPVDMTLTLTDANGNVTQPSNDDRVRFAVSPVTDDSVTLLPNPNPVTADLMSTGRFTYQASAADQGTYAVTAVPQGILSNSVTAQTSYILVSGNISSVGVLGQAVVAPAEAQNFGSPVAEDALVPSGTSSITVGFRAADANSTVRYAVWTADGTVDGVAARGLSTAKFYDTTVGANGRGTFTFSLAGRALQPFNTIMVQQVTGSNGTTGTALEILQVPNFPGAGSVVIPQGNLVAALGAATPVNVVVVDLYGQPSVGTTVFAYRGSYASTPIASGKVGADGLATFTVTNAASAVNGSTEVYKFQIQTPDGSIEDLGGQDLIVRYTTTGAITSMVAVTDPVTVTASGRITQQPLVTVPDDGYVEDFSSASVNPQTGAVNVGFGIGEFFTVTPLASPGTNVTITAPEGAKLVSPLLSDEPSELNPILWSGGSQTVVVPNGTPVAVFATKTGSHSLTMTPYGATTPSVTVPFTVVNNPLDGYTLTAEPTKITVDNVSFQNFKVSVKDVFGNPVPGAVVAAGSTGDILLGGLRDDNTLVTGTDGTATATVIALRNAGSGVVNLAGIATGEAGWNTLQPGYEAPPGAPTQPVTTAKVDVTIQAKADPAITIVGERAQVSGKTGVKVDGGSTGFVTGTEMTPMVRFPGQTEYTAGSARPTTNAMGDFTWQRKTGKKVYIFFESGAIKSNRIIIQAK